MNLYYDVMVLLIGGTILSVWLDHKQFALILLAISIAWTWLLKHLTVRAIRRLDRTQVENPKEERYDLREVVQWCLGLQAKGRQVKVEDDRLYIGQQVPNLFDDKKTFIREAEIHADHIELLDREVGSQAGNDPRGNGDQRP